MTALLFLGLIVFAALLFDTRRRLANVESELASRDWSHSQPRAFEPPAFQPEPILEREAVPEPELEPAPEPLIAREPMVTQAMYAPVRKAPGLGEPAIRPEPEPELSQEDGWETPEPVAAQGFNFEDLFGRKLPIWAGGITLLVAAVFLVRYSIEAGLLAPWVRVSLGALFGCALLAGAELARRRAQWIDDDRVAQALAGAGLGTLYAATLAATNLYGLIGPGLAFAALATLTLAAGVLALRFGAPSALLGLLGGLATPALIQSQQPNVPLLAAYIAVLTGGLTLLSRRQRWVWLGISALVGGAGWSLVMIAMGALDTLSTLATGSLVLLLGVGLPLAWQTERDGGLIRIVAACVAALQLALLVAMGGFALLNWGLYGLLAIAFLWLSARMEGLKAITLVPLFTALGLLGFWSVPQPVNFAIVLSGMAVIFGGHGLWRIGREGSAQDALALSALSLAGYGALAWHFEPTGMQATGYALALALPAVLGALVLWRRAQGQASNGFAVLAASAAVLGDVALCALSADWALPLVHAAFVMGLAALALVARNQRLPIAAALFQTVGFASLFCETTGAEWLRLFVEHAQDEPVHAVLRWGALVASSAVLTAVLARLRLGRGAYACGQVATVLLGYGALAQVFAAPWLASGLGGAALVAAIATRKRPALWFAPGIAAAGVLAALWALVPTLTWIMAAARSLVGEPVLVANLPGALDALRLMLVPAGLLGAALLVLGVKRPSQRHALVALGGISAAGGHVLYKTLFAIDDLARFQALGFAERTVWEGLLIAGGVIVWKAAQRLGLRLGQGAAIGAGLVGAGFAHFALYTAALHDPVWAQQAVGRWPLVNLLPAAFGLAFAALWSLEAMGREAYASDAHMANGRATGVARLADLVRIPLVVLFVVELVRQAFVGSTFALAPMGASESIVWSVLAVALAIGFLLWGIRKRSRDWRIASLVLMLGAVGKVFVFDAAGLEGLLRIGSFLALGFSLIGIGWLYSRYLKPVAQG